MHAGRIAAVQVIVFEPMYDSYAGMALPPSSPGVTLTYVGTATGWNGSATHTQQPSLTCVIGVGTSTPPTLAEGQPGGVNCK